MNTAPYLARRIRLPERFSPVKGPLARLALARRRASRKAGATQQAQAFARRLFAKGRAAQP